MNINVTRSLRQPASLERIVCLDCGTESPLEGIEFQCHRCKGVLSLVGNPIFEVEQVDSKIKGIWRYQHTFPLTDNIKPISLGEGNTPMVDVECQGRRVYFKLEYLNPTGSFKDRGTGVLISLLAALGFKEAVEDSSGNAGASFAAYCARARIKAKIFTPQSTSATKIKQLGMYNAEVVRIEGPRVNAMRAAQSVATDGLTYASHVSNPLGLAGLATAAFEIWEQLGEGPDVIVLPLGQGTLLLGLYRGFKILLRSGLIKTLPEFIGVQAKICAPLWKIFTSGEPESIPVTEQETIAEGIRITNPFRSREVCAALEECNGRILLASEEAIIQGAKQLAKEGFYVEYTSAVVWPALQEVLANRFYGTIVVMLTGNGLKIPASQFSL